MISITREQLLALAPGALPVYLDSFDRSADWLTKFGVTDTALRVAHFLSQCLEETGGMRITEEDLFYSAERMCEVWPSRFATPADAAPLAGNARGLANSVYGGRMGNQAGTDDGWNYRGRGLLQETGRAGYRAVGALIGVDLEAKPGLILSTDYAVAAAAASWHLCNAAEAADRDDICTETRRINGGLIGLDQRRAWLVRTRAMVMGLRQPGAAADTVQAADPPGDDVGAADRLMAQEMADKGIPDA